LEDKTILVVEDDSMMLEFLQEALESRGYSVETASAAAEALELFKSKHPDLVITDIKMPGVSGLDFLADLRSLNRRVPVIVITAYADLEKAEKAIKYQASDFIKKPFEAPEILEAVRRQLQFAPAVQNEHRLIYTSEEMEKIVALVAEIAPRPDPLLIQGESGVGKEVIARHVHYQSDRFDAPLVAVNCGAIPSDLLESELFGHTEGAFTGASKERKGLFQAAEGGTLLLDEIGEIPLALQPRLLRVLETGEVKPVGSDSNVSVDVRIIAATNQDLVGLVESGEFREDLFYRLNVYVIKIPPLRDRREDIPVLFKHFMDRYHVDFIVSDELMKRLSFYPWPGNVRQIQNVIRRLNAAVSGEVSEGDLKSVGINLTASPDSFDCGQFPPRPDLQTYLDNMKKNYLEKALEETDGNKAAAARLLGIKRTTLVETIKRYGDKEI
jgi:DNA-binding NtrC family response regulator